MTFLETKADRDFINIDSFERAIVYSLLLLYKAIKDPNNPVPANENPYINAISFNLPDREATTTNLNATVNLPFNRIEAAELGGNYLESLGTFGSTNPAPLEINCSPSTSEFVELISEPDYINTLEKYFAWLCHIVKGDLLLTNLQNSNVIQTQFLNENPDFPKLRIQLRLPINFRNYLRTNSLICSVEALLTQPVAPPDPGGGATSEIGDDGDFGNNFDVGNGSTAITSDVGNQGNVGNQEDFGD